MNENIEELEIQIKDCRKKIYDMDLSFEERKMYRDTYFDLLKVREDLKNEKKKRYFDYVKLGSEIVTIAGGLWTIVRYFDEKKWKTSMMLGFTAWEKENRITSSFGKELQKNITKFN